MVDVLLSTYNGGKYLNEQINSILYQSYEDWKLTIRDDGSKDDTISIIQVYVERYPQKVKWLKDDYGNVGVTRSFELLLTQSTADYVMFSDQDDVWMHDKIFISMQEMQQLESKYGHIPLLVHTDLLVVDQALGEISPSYRDYVGINPWLLDSDIHYMVLSNPVTGCTMLFNKKAREASLPFPSPVEMHDIWVALCVKKMDGMIEYIKRPTICYRQHVGNVCGAKSANSQTFLAKLGKIRLVYYMTKDRYYYYHPLVYKTMLHLLYYKLKYYMLRLGEKR